MVLYGGRTATDTWLDDTWIWDGSSWTQVQLTPHPAIRFPFGTYDAAIGKFVVYGLKPDYSGTQTWTWDGTWQQVPISSAPPGRFSSAMTYDARSQQVILFGGRQTLGHLGDTWAFDGTGWKQLTPTMSPAPRQNHVMASVSQGAVLYGGSGEGTSFTDTWIWNGTQWQQLVTVHSPSGWGAAGMASRNGQAFMVHFRSIDGPAETFSFLQGDWSGS
jgi:hypothetical protein